ncbi:MAG: noncanonical pyrimidine nucleotidase, YjjG family [Spirochaetes bacterium GWD1_27_9]|nr:MAG: noncanonical pyrimidine nucleotidase, YjjG family [Spirochaetes bacterium GWB1_27_13]OHD21829.1 MAG: noncanonical pyrimidine nucleotidase, YjjG family [Spirochaetes bacterium GWC1_27_15]OHD30025.1 MAG: noncanonical pyrimidine nucleotidase, YjjG family [Spirochaetes bacterium GWD1_27_9]
MNYELILFDADGTLLDYEKSEQVALENTFLKFNLQFLPSYLLYYNEINQQFWKDLENNLTTVERLKIERFEKLIEKIGIKVSAADFARDYLYFLSKTQFFLPNTEIILEKLSKKYKLAIITNGLSIVQRGRFNNSIISDYIKDFIISEEIGFSKPNKEIFTFTLDKLSHNDKKTTLIVGDSLTSDIKGGFDFGIDTCWFNPLSKKNSTNIKPTYEIKDILELEQILEG